ncbi:hypothetical protein TRIP_B200307 [uncultured Desulfatiglans sp.]|nr:hypothetical protein TRIP_B200307 [uncultured Desulfatiglans sp.]
MWRSPVYEAYAGAPSGETRDAGRNPDHWRLPKKGGRAAGRVIHTHSDPKKRHDDEAESPDRTEASYP